MSSHTPSTHAPTHLYLVSDLHWGGDGQLQVCEYTTEFVDWLKTLEVHDKSTELLIVGDTFGLWESTTMHGPPALEEIIRHHGDIFEQLKRTGERITITMLVGNHDYELACDPKAYGEILARYNIRLVIDEAVLRDVGGRRIWIEHGQQFDVFNRSEDYGNRYALPPGFFITETVVGGASRHSEFGTSTWLKDIRSVATMQIPDWVVSNYFYREMSPYLRWLLLPFMLMFGVSIVVLIGAALRAAGMTQGNFVFSLPIFTWFHAFGDVLRFVLEVNAAFMTFLLMLAIPLTFVIRDARRAMLRFRLMGPDGFDPDVDSIEPYMAGARKVFADHPDVSVFVFGHTHDAFLESEPDGRIVFNTGTWLKLLRRVPVRFGYLPSVYVPSFRLNYFHLHSSDGEPVIDYVEIPKTPDARELTGLQKLLLFGRRPPEPRPIAARTVIPARVPVEVAGST
ncbi:MAG: phosphoesterase [Proteobacteria bacterium]|nr:phosphoesterase [Pseudomonadota bacterium]